MTKTTINPDRRREIKEVVLSSLKRIPDAALPVNIKEICKSYSNIRLIPFSVHMKRRNLSYEDVKAYCGTSGSCADYYADFDKYIIYYNDVDKTSIVDSNRYRWNIAHELGHILLDHHKKYNKTRIFRLTLSDQEYNYLEEEADYFAQLILVPYVVLYAFKVRNATQIKQQCKISGPAATRRFYAYNEWMSNPKGNDQYDRELLLYYYNFIYKKECRSCGAHLIQAKGRYCPICGKNTLQWGDGKMIYSKFASHENGKLKVCPICQNEETLIEGDFCQICGNGLVNYCINDGCSNAEILPANARYCPVCGYQSSFFQNNILQQWNYKKSNSDDGFMHIPDGIDEELPFN